MKRGRRSANERARARLLDSWQRRPEYGPPIGCVATTFTFDPAHFEEHCLARFLGMQTDPAEDARGYLIEREDHLSEALACVLVDQAHVCALRSLRWHVLPVRVEAGGILHAKVSLLVWEKRIRVLVGSANLTAPGYRHNVENQAALDFTPDGELPLGLLRDAIALMDRARRAAPGYGADDGPQPRLDRFLRGVEATVSSWAEPAWSRGQPVASLVCTGPGQPPLFDQLKALWTGAAPREAWVVSRFFDDGDGAVATIGALEAVLTRRGRREIHVVGAGRRLPDGLVELDMPSCLASPPTAGAAVYLRRVVAGDGDGEGEAGRALHAKALWLERKGRAVFCIGSSNFTAAGTGRARAGRAGPVNIEANVAYQIPDMTDDFGRVCWQAYPASEPIDPADDDVRFLGTDSRTTEPEGHALLPACFGAALYRAGESGPQLDLEIVDAPPAGCAVHAGSADHAAHGDGPLLPADSWRGLAYPVHLRVPWPHARPPSHLAVEWTADGVDRVAIWVVNVADVSALPPLEELQGMRLDELLAVLTSARPAHEVIAKILRRRGDGPSTRKVPLDPHRKVDTRGFLLKRMRRVSMALEGLRARLERPVYLREALDARLRGFTGPLALARRLAADDPDSAAFLIAEIALTLHAAQLQPRGELSPDDAQAMVSAVIAELPALVGAHPAPPNLAAYVASTFEEVTR